MFGAWSSGMDAALDLTPAGAGRARASASVRAERQTRQDEVSVEAPRQHRPRQRTLVLLRWVAVAGQTAVLLGVHFGLDYETPLAWCLLTIGMSAWLNGALYLTRTMQSEVSDAETLLQVGFDILQATVLIALTGGMNNPFALLLIGPVAVGTAALPPRPAMVIFALGFACATALKYVHLPLPWTTPSGLDLPYVYEVGMWTATVVGMGFTAGYAWLASRESARMELALAMAQHVLAREQQLSALGALAASAAHELGTPLATIQITAKEMSRVAPPDGGLQEDALLLVSQAERCRDILKRLSREPNAGDPMNDRVALDALLEEAAEPHRGSGPDVVTTVRAKDGAVCPVIARSPEIVHALSAFVENAVDFAASHVILLATHDADNVTIEVADDGPGFSPGILAKLGEPYVTSRPNAEGSRSGHSGMGLGFFIAKTLLERSGAGVTFRNGRRGGAVVCCHWRRDRLEADASGRTTTL